MIQQWPDFANSTYVSDEWESVGQALSRFCVKSETYGCASTYCVLSYSSAGSSGCSVRHTALLKPLDCPNFTVNGGNLGYETPFLTWLDLQSYESNLRGATGGLNLEADDEHGTWACVAVPQCGITSQDFTCFKYSSVRGEFHFWDYNSVLKLLPPLIQYDVSFCSIDSEGYGVLRVTDAIDGFPVSTVDVSFTWTNPNGVVSFAGELFNLGLDGCGFFKLAADEEWALSIFKPNYYVWTGAVAVDGQNFTVSVALEPVLESISKTALSIVLTWGEYPYDFDLWLILPNSSTLWEGSQSIGGLHAVNWRSMIVTNAGRCRTAECSPLQIKRTQDVMDGFGPETIIVNGTLLEGLYRVFVTLNTSAGDSSIDLESISPPVVEVYSENEESRVIRLVEGIATRGQPSANNFWWHALDLRVSAGPAQVSKVEACVSLDVIDLFVQGFDDNKVKNTITGDIELGGIVMNSSTLFCETEGGVVEGLSF